MIWESQGAPLDMLQWIDRIHDIKQRNFVGIDQQLDAPAGPTLCANQSPIAEFVDHFS